MRSHYHKYLIIAHHCASHFMLSYTHLPEIALDCRCDEVSYELIHGKWDHIIFHGRRKMAPFIPGCVILEDVIRVESHPLQIDLPVAMACVWDIPTSISAHHFHCSLSWRRWSWDRREGRCLEVSHSKFSHLVCISTVSGLTEVPLHIRYIPRAGISV